MRKLATVTLSFSAAICAANYCLPQDKLIILAVITMVLGAVLLAVFRKRRVLAASALIFFALGLLCYFFHHRNTVEVAKQYSGETHSVTALILDYPEVYNDYCRLDVRVKSPYLPNFKAVLYDNEKQLTDVKPGDVVILLAKLSTADTIYGQKYDNYHSKGIYFKLNSKGVAALHRVFDLRFLPQYISHGLSARIDRIFPDDTEVFMRSLLLGDKSDFYADEEMYVSLSKAGLMHIVAVSGMHISFLVGLLHGLFGRGRKGALSCLLIVWFFALLTGAGPSVIRAAFMHSCYLMAPVVRRENDSLTSLALVLALLLCVNPFAIAGISLQLSFGAMCGIVLFSDRIYLKFLEKVPGSVDNLLLRGILSSISCSLSVMVFTVPLTAIHFGNVQLLAPLANLISLWAVSICFCWGWISCALSFVPFLGIMSASLCSWLARYILFAAKLISSVPLSVMYMRSKAAWIWLMSTYVLLAIAYSLKKRRFYAFIAATLASALFASAIIAFSYVYHRKNDSIDILNVGQGQCISVLTDEACVLLDCGNINTIDDAATIAAAHLYSRGRYKVDVLLLSHLHEDHAGAAVRLMEMIDIGTLIIPGEYDDKDKLFADIEECAIRNGTEIITITENCEVHVGDIEMYLIKSGFGSDENERCIITRLENNGFTLLAMADASRKMEQKLVQEYELEDVDALVVSHHGSKYSSTDSLLEEIEGRIAIISVGQNYFGHPAQETLEALEAYGYNVYRTDVNGNIEIKTGNNYGKKSW